MKPLRIVRIVARLAIGGPAVHISHLAAALDRERFESHLITGRPSGDEGDMSYLAEQLQVDTIKVPSLRRELSLFRDVRTVWRLTRLLRRLRPDIVETHTAKAGAVGRVAARLAGAPVIIHVFHGHTFRSYFSNWKTRLFKNVERFLGRYCTHRIIVFSEQERQDIVERFRIAAAEKVEVIPMGLNLQPFVEAATSENDLRAEWGFDDSQILVGIVGRLTAIKNPKLLLQAAELIRGQAPDVRFVIVGDGELRAELEQFVNGAGLTDRVTFAGWRREMPDVYAALDIVALTSNNEGTPTSLIEALATARAVVATNVGSVAHVVTDQRSGLLTEAEDPQQLADALVKLASEPALRKQFGEQGQRDVLERYCLERLTNDMQQLYERLSSASGKGAQ